MKTFLVGFIIIASLPLSARTFTSADGSRTMEAKLFSYNPSNDTVVLQIDGQNTRTTTKASHFSDKDQEFFQKFLRESEKYDALRVNSSSESESFENKRGIYIYDKKKEHFSVTIKNRGDFDFENLDAEYDVYFYKFDKEGKKSVETLSGTESIESISSKDSVSFGTQAVEINIDCASTSSCPKCVKFAASVERERVIGVRVRIHGSDEELLTEYYSSNSTRTIAEKVDSES